MNDDVSISKIFCTNNVLQSKESGDFKRFQLIFWVQKFVQLSCLVFGEEAKENRKKLRRCGNYCRLKNCEKKVWKVDEVQW